MKKDHESSNLWSKSPIVYPWLYLSTKKIDLIGIKK